jgi:hypothetical protein
MERFPNRSWGTYRFSMVPAKLADEMNDRLRLLLLLPLVAIFGLAAKHYSGPGRWWVNNWGPASVAYVVFFILLAALFLPRRRAAAPIAASVLLATCGLEFLQLWQPPWLQAARSTFVGAMLLGTTFSWWDFPAYIVGAVVGWMILRWTLSSDRPSIRKAASA